MPCTRNFLALLLCGLLTVGLSGCRDDKMAPYSPIPGNGTPLYIAECEPFEPNMHDREIVTLVPEYADACTTPIRFFGGYLALWTSNLIRPDASEVTEGVHLVFNRDLDEVLDSTRIQVEYQGVAVHVTQQVILPPGSNPSVLDLFETGIVAAPLDSQRFVTFSIRMLAGSASLNLAVNTGTYVQVGVDRSKLCEFEIDLGLNGGIGNPNSGVNFSYLEASGEIQTDIFLDFSRGAHLDGLVFVFGPKYGVAYLSAISGGCRDTALFLAPPPSQHYRVDTLTTPSRSNLLSDGNQVWYWGDERLPEDSLACREVWIRNAVEWEILSHSVYDCQNSVLTYYDQSLNLFWIIERSASRPDTAWGYSISGNRDTLVIAETIPNGFLYRHSWLQESARDDYTRVAAVQPFAGGDPLPFGEYPVELSEVFGGGAGIGYPNAFDYDWWSVNVFDTDGNWIARYPVKSRLAETSVFSVSLLGADSVIVYEMTTSAEHEVRALKLF